MICLLKIQGKREIQTLQVRCANTERGCQWTGTVDTTFDDHIASCLFPMVSCPNKCEEDKGTGELLFIRKHLDQHLNMKCPKRPYECRHCGKKGTFSSIEEEHYKSCKKKIVACPNKKGGCTLSIERAKTKDHMNSDCVYTEVACIYGSLGCGVRMLRKDREKREKEDREKHMDKSLATVKLLSEQHEALTAIVKTSENKQQSLEINIVLKDKHHKRLTQQHKELSRKNEALTKKVEMLSEKYRTLSDMVNLHKEQNKTLTMKDKYIFILPKYTSKKEKNERFLSLPFYTLQDMYL